MDRAADSCLESGGKESRGGIAGYLNHRTMRTRRRFPPSLLPDYPRIVEKVASLCRNALKACSQRDKLAGIVSLFEKFGNLSRRT